MTWNVNLQRQQTYFISSWALNLSFEKKFMDKTEDMSNFETDTLIVTNVSTNLITTWGRSQIMRFKTYKNWMNIPDTRARLQGCLKWIHVWFGWQGTYDMNFWCFSLLTIVVMTQTRIWNISMNFVVFREKQQQNLVLTV